MRNQKNQFRVEFLNGYCAGVSTFIPEGESSGGTESGVGFGHSIAVARRRAKANKKIVGNVHVEWVHGEERIYKNGTLIRRTY